MAPSPIPSAARSKSRSQARVADATDMEELMRFKSSAAFSAQLPRWKRKQLEKEKDTELNLRKRTKIEDFGETTEDADAETATENSLPPPPQSMTPVPSAC